MKKTTFEKFEKDTESMDYNTCLVYDNSKGGSRFMVSEYVDLNNDDLSAQLSKADRIEVKDYSEEPITYDDADTALQVMRDNWEPLADMIDDMLKIYVFHFDINKISTDCTEIYVLVY